MVIMPSRNGPDSGSRLAFAVSTIRSAAASSVRAWATISPPIGVIRTLRLVRSNKVMPSSSSSLRICALRVGWPTKQGLRRPAEMPVFGHGDGVFQIANVHFMRLG